MVKQDLAKIQSGVRFSLSALADYAQKWRNDALKHRFAGVYILGDTGDKGQADIYRVRKIESK